MPPSPRPAGHPAKTPSAASSSWQSSNAPPFDKQRRGEGRDEGDGVRFFDRCLDRCAPYRPPWPSPSHRISPAWFSIPGRRQFPGWAYIPRRFPQLILSAIGSSSHPSPLRRSIRTGGQASSRRQGDPRFRHRIPASSRHSPRLAPRVARAGRMASRSRRPTRLAVPVPPPVPVAGQGIASARSRSHHDKQAGRGGPSPFRPSCRLRGSSPDPSVNRRKGKAKRPAPPYRGTGRKAFRRFIGRGYCSRRHPSYRRRYRWPVPAPGDSSRRR